MTAVLPPRRLRVSAEPLMPTRQRTSGEYLAMLARELRNPLGPIRSNYSGRCRATSNVVHELRSRCVSVLI
jgi:hypothetical protein